MFVNYTMCLTDFSYKELIRRFTNKSITLLFQILWQAVYTFICNKQNIWEGLVDACFKFLDTHLDTDVYVYTYTRAKF